jgi:DNA ligase-1
VKRFAELYAGLDRTNSTNEKIAALVDYFHAAAPADAAWAVWFLTGRRLQRLVPSSALAAWAREAAGVPEWLFEECYGAVGDLAETVALLLDANATPAGGESPPAIPDTLSLAAWVEERLLPLRAQPEAAQREAVVAWWRELERWPRFVLGKLLTGALRVGVAQTLVERALSEVAKVEPQTIAQRLMGTWEPTAEFFSRLVGRIEEGEDVSRPYPFALASPLDLAPSELGEVGDWLMEWKWDGIRAQLIRRGGDCFLWSRGEELLTERFPEIVRIARSRLPEGMVLDGEILAMHEGRPLPFSVLQRRIGRIRLTERVLAEAPAAFVAYDLLEAEGDDLRDRPLAERRARLAEAIEPAQPILSLSPEVVAESWEAAAAERLRCRELGVEGLMIKRLGSPYRAGRRRGDWWKWKIDPYEVDAVLLYAQPGHGRRASLCTDYTFGVWDGSELVTFAKAYSGLTDDEIVALDLWIRQNTIERFGPVRSVPPVQVFTLAFEGIARSARHRSGVAVRFPRIARWRPDKRAEEADTLERLRALLVATRRV